MNSWADSPRCHRHPDIATTPVKASPTGTYMGDPPPGLSVRGAFFGWKSDQEVCGGVVSVVSESSFALTGARVPGRPRAGRRVLGVRLGACRPSTVRAYAHDLSVFFGVVGKEPTEVTPKDVLRFVTAQRRPRNGAENVVRISDGGSGLSTSTIKRRLAAVSSLYGYLVIRGDTGRDHQPGATGSAHPAQPSPR